MLFFWKGTSESKGFRKSLLETNDSNNFSYHLKQICSQIHCAFLVLFFLVKIGLLFQGVLIVLRKFVVGHILLRNWRILDFLLVLKGTKRSAMKWTANFLGYFSKNILFSKISSLRMYVWYTLDYLLYIHTIWRPRSCNEEEW